MRKKLRQIYLYILSRISYEKYARKIGVSIGKDCRLHGRPGFGSEPYLISLGDHVLTAGGVGRVSFITHEGGH